MSNVVPSEWMKSDVNSICDVLDSKRIPLNSQERATRQGDYPYYGANGVQGYIDDYIFEGEHVLLAEDGGNFGQWEYRPISYLVSGKFWVNNHAHILKAKGENETKFIHYSLVHKNILKHINGGTRAKLNQSDMRDIELLRPPLPEQQKIATILSSVDDVIERTQAQIDKLKDLKTGMMQELLTKGIGHTEFKDSPVGRIPVGWDVKPIPEVSSYQNGKAFPSSDYLSLESDGYFLVKPVNLDPDGKVNWNYGSSAKLKPSYWDDAEAYRVRSNEILMNLTAQSLEDDFLGRVCITKEGEQCILNQRIARINTNGNFVTQRYLFWALKGHFFRAHVEKVTQGSKVQHLYNNNLDSALIAFPNSTNEQEKICRSLDSVEDAICANSLKLTSNQKTKKALMQDLLTGKVRVSVN